MSLSQLVDLLLERKIGSIPAKAGLRPFGERWAGRFQVAERKEPRFERLRAKYDL